MPESVDCDAAAVSFMPCFPTLSKITRILAVAIRDFVGAGKISPYVPEWSCLFVCLFCLIVLLFVH